MDENMDMTLQARVGRGISLLDANSPGWRDAVDLDELDMSSTRSEIRAQVARQPQLMNYEPALIVQAVETGFMPVEDESYDELTDGWKAALADA